MPKQALIQNVSRRGFLKGVGAATGFVVALQFLPRGAFAAETYATGAGEMPHGTVNDPHVFISIDPSGTVTIVTHRSEMGTGIRTSLPMVVADELEADWSRVRLTQAPADEPRYGNQDTDGSRSMRHFIQPMRQCGAAMRQMLEEAAAREWKVPVSEVQAANHEVVHSGSGRRLGYGDLAQAAMDLPTPPLDQLKLKKDAAFRYMGKGNISIYDLDDIITGKAQYGYDTMLPGMKFAVVAHPPVVGGKVKSFDASETLKVPGVEKVIEIQTQDPRVKFTPLGGIAVVASNTYAAMKGKEALKIEWDDGPNASYDSAAYKAEMEKTARQPSKIVRNEGDPEKAFSAAARKVTAEYYVPHLACAPMEPPVATAVVGNGQCEVWAPLQYPYGAREDLAKLLNLPMDKVKVNVTLLGGGFGRKSQADFAQEAALVSQALGGVPVKLAWSREDDIQHSFYHTVSLDHLEAALDEKGKVTGWLHRTVAPSLMSTFMPDPKHEHSLELAMGVVDVPFAIPNIRCENGEAAAHTRIGWFRSVANIPHAFAAQSFVAELAHSLGRDSKDFLLELIGPARKLDIGKTGMVEEFWNYGDPYETYPIDTGRLANVVRVAADGIGWGRTLPKGHGLGIAAHRSFLSYVATAIEVAIDDQGNLSVPRVDTAIDCGFAVNPERIRSQIEGAAVMGMSSTMFSEITFEKGRAVQANYDTYEVARIDTSPLDVRTHIIPHGYDVPASGVGEPGVPPFAPALCNAIFAATGKRIRTLPIGGQDLRAI
ncbi:xanthine dehydrogenase family protein molybdopterin-binding subunit [Skermanella pratensis]|uniref:xanthine dehydrogenase family protein molybdopterin-binding subunit n=1 Tax=Skermanella pratensis TaxID=2233999 RepID=UPI0013017D58|nr:molybdopterin cofactor-binding domain-containing protein [Skermanella pratensis]